MKKIQSHSIHNKKQRRGIYFLIALIVIIQVVFYNIDFSTENETVVNTNKLLVYQAEFDSLVKLKEAESKPKIFPFNPNYITDYKGYQLGLNVEEIDKLHAFRKQGKFVNSVADFKRVTGVSDSILNTIKPYFKFPEWVTKQKKSKPKYIQPKIEITDLNLATEADFKKIRGIGEVLSSRIVKYRDKLQGYSYPDQLYEVWGLKKEVANKVLKHFKITSLPEIKKVNVNTASFKQVLHLPYIDYELTKKIFNYRDEVAEIQSLDELKKIDDFPLEKFNRIALYLEAK